MEPVTTPRRSPGYVATKVAKWLLIIGGSLGALLIVAIFVFMLPTNGVGVLLGASFSVALVCLAPAVIAYIVAWAIRMLHAAENRAQ